MGTQIFLDLNDIKIKEKDIQGDVLVGLQKRQEIFVFFNIRLISDALADSVLKFKKVLKKFIPTIATSETTRVYEQTHGPASLDVKVNIAFTSQGLTRLGAPDFHGADPSFLKGMKAQASALGDDVANEWLPAFSGGRFDGVIIVAGRDSRGGTPGAVQAKASDIVKMFGSTITHLHSEAGRLNPGAQEGHEAFGFADGVSQPAVDGLHKPVAADDQSFAGQDIVALGDFVLGDYDMEKGGKSTPPAAWMTNGSYLVFRRLRQDVDGFNSYTQGNFEGHADSADHFAAKLVGRWKNGSPLARDPVSPDDSHDDKHPTENNDFEFGVVKVGQSRCPFNAHIRRVYPRSDIQGGVDNAEARRILRAGIAYDQSTATKKDQGLLFVCYQSSIVDKFEFIQTSWCNQPSIPFDPPYPVTSGQTKNPMMPAKPGIDLIIGQTAPSSRGADWTINDGDGPAVTLTDVPKFVTSTGGDYFFSPSISGLNILASPDKGGIIAGLPDPHH